MICREVFGSSEAVGSSTSSNSGFWIERAADADPLALPAGQLVGALVGHVIKADALEQPECLVDVGLRKAAQPALPEADIAEPAGEHVLHHREALDQRVFLEDHAHAPAHAAQVRAAELDDVDVIERDRCRRSARPAG